MAEKIYTPVEIQQMREALKQQYPVYHSMDKGLDYDKMSPSEVIKHYDSWISGADEYWMNERR